MVTLLRSGTVATLVAVAAVGCARAAAPSDTSAAPAVGARQAQAARTSALDSARARRLCASPDSVLAGAAPCVLRDQGVLPPVRPAPRP